MEILTGHVNGLMHHSKDDENIIKDVSEGKTRPKLWFLNDQSGFSVENGLERGRVGTETIK